MIETTGFRLDNGLRVVHNYMPSTAMVAVVTLYDVGARDEHSDHTGLAHLFEHLMFGGSQNVDDFDGELQKAGGTSNAWTSNDFTVFYDVVPVHNLETVFRLESDRMLRPALSDKSIDVQRSVVIEEFKQRCLNQPYGDRSHLLRSAAFTVHPYSWPVIGKSPDHIRDVSREEIIRFFDEHYGPDSAVIAVCGNVSAEEVRRLVEKWYGDIPARNIASRNLPQEPPQTAPRLVEASGNVPSTTITLAWKMDGYGTPGYYAADLLTDVMANGHASRFYRQLMMESGQFANVDASIWGSEEPGLLMVNATLLHKGERAEKEALDSIWQQLDRLIAEAPSDYELQRVLNRNESTVTFNNMSYLNKAINLARCEIHGININDEMKPYLSVSPQDIQRTALEIFNPDRLTTVIYRPA